MSTEGSATPPSGVAGHPIHEPVFRALMVSAGQPLRAALQVLRLRPGEVVPGEGVVSGDEPVAGRAGLVSVAAGTVSVHPAAPVRETLTAPAAHYRHGVHVEGDLRSGTLRADGPVAVSGTVAGSQVRADGAICVSRAGRARLLCTGDVFVAGTLRHCETAIRGVLRAAPEAVLVGGTLAAAAGFHVHNLGDPGGTHTEIVAGVDRFGAARLAELDEEIAACRHGIQRISQALRPLAGAESSPRHQAARAQWAALEQRLQELQREHRASLLGAKERTDAVVVALGTVHPGVVVRIHDASLTVEATLAGVAFVRRARVGIEAVPLAALRAA